MATAINEMAATVQEVAEDNARIGTVLDVSKGIAGQTCRSL